MQWKFPSGVGDGAVSNVSGMSPQDIVDSSGG